MNNILKNIISIRENKGLSQENLADSLGMKQGSYSLIESGKRELKYSTLVNIADSLGYSVLDIIAYPNQVITNNEMQKESNTVEAILQIRLTNDKKNQVLSLVFGDNNLEILNK